MQRGTQTDLIHNDDDGVARHGVDRAPIRRAQDIKRDRTLAAYQMHHQLDADGVDALTTPVALSVVPDALVKTTAAESIAVMLEQGYVRRQARGRGSRG